MCLHALFLMSKTEDQTSLVLSHDLYWENKMYKRIKKGLSTSNAVYTLITPRFSSNHRARNIQLS